MHGLIQDRPLLLSGALTYAARYHGDTPVVSRERDGSFHVSTWAETDQRVRALADTLTRRGIRRGDRLATLAWNNHRHLEIYFAVTAIGAICHPINPRLFLAQAIYVAQHAEDRALFFDTEYAAIAGSIAEACPGIELLIHLNGSADPTGTLPPGSECYESLIRDGNPDFGYPEVEERAAASLCYTSGTTGNPKGVLFTHRALVLHAMTARTSDLFDLSPRSVACAIVPLYHAHASWGLPFAAAMSGTALVLAGLQLDGASLVTTVRTWDVTVANGVPTIWQGVMNHLGVEGSRIGSLERIVVGGSAPAPSLIETFEVEHGVDVCQFWGMTETGPCATSGALHRSQFARPGAERLALKRKQGHGLFGVEMRIVDDAGAALPWGEKQIGQLQVRGPFVISGYFKAEGPGAVGPDGWFKTGDIACIDETGYLRLIDRAKDLVKSGGEWISSIDVENAALAFPGVQDAAAIPVPHEKWGERPLLLLVPKPGAQLIEGDILTFLSGRLAKWWLPDRVLLVKQLPRNGSGKLMKTELRKQYAHLGSIGVPEPAEYPAA